MSEMDDTVETTDEKGTVVSYIPSTEVDGIKNTCFIYGAMVGFIFGIFLVAILVSVL